MQLLMLLTHLITTAALEVRTGRTPVVSLLKSNVVLHCQFATPTHAKLEDVAVKWTVKTNAGIKSLYAFDGSHSEYHRAGAYVNLSSLSQGNASLNLHSLTLEDEGQYTCMVLIPPEFGSGTIQLKISAQPSVSISPINPLLTEGEEKTFFCDVHHFYPQEIDISWIMQKGSYRQAMKKGICTGIPTVNSNGTFSSSSRITLVVSKDDEGTSYVCQVKHESVEHPLCRNTTIFLSRTHLHHTTPGYVIGVAFVSVLVTGTCSIIFTIFYQKRFAEVRPLISSIILPECIAVNEEITLTCNINGFRPKSICVSWHIERNPADPKYNTSERTCLLRPEDIEDITNKAKQDLKKQGRLFSMTSCVFYTPTLKDDGATFTCSVEHKALKKTVSKSATLKVTAQPSSHLITCWPRVPAIGENLTLTCMVEKFYPKDITLTWLKNGLPIQRSTQFGPFSCERSFFSVWSQMSFPLTKDDEGHVYTCQINHSSFRKIKELSYEINLKGTPPEVLWITADPDPPQLGKELRLSCRINNYSPENISVKWLRNEQILHHGTCNSSSAVSANGLHSMWSVLKCLPDRDDHLSMFVCKVEHVASKTCEERSYTLQLFS